ncbi:jg22225 [Pararge aegeria aegeria]|uniref:Jg22225 protein n=1 Tax=Pararge aegeria aegeria TaxID=348720 RepID=A0A8S4SQG5_9NEOP|nr:jg22225 [Pararge aegeria aegeria]
MKTIWVLFSIFLTAITSVLGQHERIIGGSVTSINTYPFAASLQINLDGSRFVHHCGGTIINNRSILTAAHCWRPSDVASMWRVRVGSTNVSSGGRLHNVAQLIRHPQNVGSWSHDNDVSIFRLATTIPLGSATLRAAGLAGPNLPLHDHMNVFAIGWGFTTRTGGLSESLRHVQLRKFTQARCRSSYGTSFITDNMLCAGWEAGGRGSCFHDSGTALVAQNVVVGITSFVGDCGHSNWPGIYTRVGRFITWIANNA